MNLTFSARCTGSIWKVDDGSGVGAGDGDWNVKVDTVALLLMA